MILSTVIELNDDDLITYSYTPRRDLHEVSIFHGWDRSNFSGSAGDMINALSGYRDIEDVRTLIAWLAK